MTLNDISNTSVQKSIENATRTKNPMENFPEFMKFTSSVDETVYNLYCKTKSDMDPRILKWAFKLAEKNVGPFYKKCLLGWQPKIKQADLNKNWARYFVAVETKTKNPIAFAMFRFDHDYGSSVLYCYEMQIEKSSQRKGLGKFMMNCLEKCAERWAMEKLVLTVLNNNLGAIVFFENLGYSVDETSPPDSEDASYKILSKNLK